MHRLFIIICMANNTLKIIIEKNIPFLDVLEPVAAVCRLGADEITGEAVRDADALIVRTRTKCDAPLLEGSKVKFIGSATIGTDHIDLQWCRANGIAAANAPGCNAPAVAQYVFASLMCVINRPISDYTIGIVGVGHVGKIVERWARILGMNVLRCDPPRSRAEGSDGFVSIREIAEKADIITFHTPLTLSGPDATYHLADSDFFNSLRRAPVIINAARGPVVDTEAWIEALRAGVCGPAIIDCWEGEPCLNTDLLELAFIATPHIAGYSVEGKRRASQMVLDSLTSHFNLAPLNISENKDMSDGDGAAAAPFNYDPLIDTIDLRSHPDSFELLRNNYKLRHEPTEPSNN